MDKDDSMQLEAYRFKVEPFLIRMPLRGTFRPQMDKLVEEAAEAFSAADAWFHAGHGMAPDSRRDVIYECCDVVQAACNLMAAVGASAQDVDEAMRSVHEANARRGRYQQDA